MATLSGTASSAARSAREWNRRRADKRAVARFGEFWAALQAVGDALAEAQKAAKNAEHSTWKGRNTRHWDIAGVDEVRSSLRRCKNSLRIVSAQAKRFEPQLIVKDWRR
jgi:G:T/U-mismatch repair DNA glycosylase